MNRRSLALCSLCLCISVARAWTQTPAVPTIDDILNLKRVGTPAVSPDGRQVAYTVRETNWDENAYETEIWVGDAATGRSRQLTNARRSSLQPAWSPDGASLAFISDRDGKRQIYRITVAGGEAERLTNGEEGVTGFAWSPSGGQMAFTMMDPLPEAMKDREKRWGDIRLEHQDQRYTHLHLLDLATRATRTLTSGAFVVGTFDWSPDGRMIAFDHRLTSDAGDSGTADISIVTVATGERQVVVAQDGPDTHPIWSPDGLSLAFVSAMAKPFYFYQNQVIAIVQPGVTGVPPITSLTDTFDENPNLLAWTKAGIAFSASQRTWSYLFSLDPGTRLVTRRAVRDQWIGTSFSLTRDGTVASFIASGPTDFPDVYVAPVSTMAAVKVSETGVQVTSWPKHAREVIAWKSQDGTVIEGVLHKPADFQAGRHYPLLVVIHGGPTGTSRPIPYSNNAGYYPVDAFLAKGALVLEPNYRGSAGYGEAFRSLNVRNLGIGDAWDVLSGIDALVAQGLVDGARVGGMGWSQGGYISAFLATKHSERFRALSVGAGISDWMTYYVNTDIQPFTRQYLKATPWDDPKIYADTSPITYIKQARTPTLIQNGDQDQRVPIPNAFELYQGLRDQHVPVELMVFKGFGHNLDKPRANRAAMQQNWDWFVKYLWNQP